MANIFISYSRQSVTVAKILANDIEALDHTVWFDQELSGGQVWWDQILATVRDCDIFVFVLDPEALSSTACMREYGYAADLGKPILPILVSEKVSTNLLPTVLSQIQFVDYKKQDRDAAFRLARALNIIPPAKPLPDPLPAVPEAPISYLGSLNEKVETTSTLSYEEQSVLVIDLKKSLRDPGNADDTRILLERLRKRRDLFATIDREIDDLLGDPRQAAPVPPRTSAPEPQQTWDTPRKRLLMVTTLAGSIIGILSGMFLFGFLLIDAVILVGLPGAIVGALAADLLIVFNRNKMNKDTHSYLISSHKILLLMVTTLAGSIIGILSAMFLFGFILIDAVILVGLPGAIVGALAADLLIRINKSK